MNAESRDGGWLFFIKDTGSALTVLFGRLAPFRRLHGPEVVGAGLGLTICRRLEILKFRGASHLKGEFPFTISSDNGIILLPLSSIELRQKSSETRISSGIAELDAMCGGGFIGIPSCWSLAQPAKAKLSLPPSSSVRSENKNAACSSPSKKAAINCTATLWTGASTPQMGTKRAVEYSQ